MNCNARRTSWPYNYTQVYAQPNKTFKFQLKIFVYCTDPNYKFYELGMNPGPTFVELYPDPPNFREVVLAHSPVIINILICIEPLLLSAVLSTWRLLGFLGQAQLVASSSD